MNESSNAMCPAQCAAVCFTANQGLFSTKVLCIDLGSTRTKAAVLRKGMSLQELRAVEIMIFDSKPLWNPDFPTQFNRSKPEGLAARVQNVYQAISVCISGIVQDQRFYGNERIPSDLKSQCEQYSGLGQVLLENDAVAWARGALTLQSLLGYSIKYPTLAVTFGTGPGAAVMFDPSHAMDLELYSVDWPFSETNACRGNQPKPNDKEYLALIHSTPPRISEEATSACELLFASSVQWIRSQTSKEEEVQQIFTTRVATYLRDIMESLEHKLQCKVETIFIGGGNAELLNQSQLDLLITKSLHVLNSVALKSLGIVPELISLIGACEGIGQTNTNTVYPELPCILAQIQAWKEEESK